MPVPMSLSGRLLPDGFAQELDQFPVEVVAAVVFLAAWAAYCNQGDHA